MLVMRWLFVGMLVALIALVLSISWMNGPNRWTPRGTGLPDQQVLPPDSPTLVPPAPDQ
jgi:hypothetical protein